MDHIEKWKLSKKDSSYSSGSHGHHHHDIASSSSTNNSKFLSRSFSTKSTSNSSSKSPLLQKSSSTKCPLPRSFSQSPKGSSISRKYGSLAKEQKARFYIMRRCVAMLVCWHKHDDP